MQQGGHNCQLSIQTLGILSYFNTCISIFDVLIEDFVKIHIYKGKLGKDNTILVIKFINMECDNNS